VTRTADPRGRMLDSAAEVLRERGTGGFTLDVVLARSGAPRGSVYHHFPGGRDELLVAGVRHAAGYITHLIDKAAAAGDVEALLEALAAFWRGSLEGSQFRAGCPVLAVAVDARPDLTEAAALVHEVFDLWRAKFTLLLTGGGVPQPRAGSLANVILAAVEGAIVLCRADRSLEPLEDTVTELRALLRSATGPPVVIVKRPPPAPVGFLSR